jgi:hypothetical protein
LLPVLVLPAAYALSALVRSRRPWAFAIGLAAIALIALAAAPLARGGMAAHLRGLNTELNVPRAQARTIGEFLAGEGKDVRVFLTDQQTYWLLRPVLRLGGRAGLRTNIEKGNSDIRLFRWEGRSFLMPQGWRLAGSRGGLVGRSHLAWMLDRLRQHREWKRQVENDEVWVIQGGLGHKLLPGLPETVGRQPIRGPSVGGSEFFAFQLYPAGYRAYVTAPAD